ncbi:MAG TPA: hypothetical protein VF234_04775 [Limnochordia bacterium]
MSRGESVVRRTIEHEGRSYELSIELSRRGASGYTTWHVSAQTPWGLLRESSSFSQGDAIKRLKQRLSELAQS